MRPLAPISELTDQLPSESIIAKISGPLLVGHLLNWALYGVLTVQVYIYYIAFPSDPWPKKAIVWTLYLLETIQTLLATHDAFGTFGVGWGDVEALQKPQLLWFSVPVMDGIISSIVQCYLAWCIYRIGKIKIFFLLLVSLSLMQGVAGITQGIQAGIIGNFSELQDKAFVSNVIWLGGSALVDVLILLGMTYCLLGLRPGFKGTQLFISKIIRLFIETGFITATIAVVDLILLLCIETDYYVCPAFTLAKFYSNNLLVIFNFKLRINGGRDDPGDASAIDIENDLVTQRDGFKFMSEIAELFQRRKGNLPDSPGVVNLGIIQHAEKEDIQLRDSHAIHFDQRQSSQHSFDLTLKAVNIPV